MLKREDVYDFIKSTINPMQVALKYLGEPDVISSNNYMYYSPLRDKERTPSFCVNEELGIHDFGTDKHYSVISFVQNLFDLSYWKATEKIIEDFDIDLTIIEEGRGMIIENKKQVENNILFEKANKPEVIYTYFDTKCFNSKPKEQKEIADIKQRIEDNTFKRYTSIQAIMQEIIKGKTCIPSAIRGNAKVNWRQQQLFLVDFDNTIEGEKIYSDNSKHVDVKKILRYCQNINLMPTFIYYTFSHSEKQHKFRLVYVLEKPIKDLKIAMLIPKYLLDKFKLFNPDTSKKNLSDMFFGGKQIAYVGENYYKIGGM